MKVYQLSKLRGKYWWTGTINADTVPEETEDYFWTSDRKLVDELNGKNI